MSLLGIQTRTAIEALLAQHELTWTLVALASGENTAEAAAFGATEGDSALGDGAPVADALFPVASVTKLATALAVLRLAAAGSLELEDPLSAHLPMAHSAVEGVTLSTLLCHTSGLPNDLKPALVPYTMGLNWDRLADACLSTALVRPPGARVTYSNVGYGLLALVVEQRTRLPFATAITGLVLDPLGIEGYLGVEPPRPPARVTGKLGEHAGTDLEPFNSLFWRSLSMPWAGLVTTAAGALALVRAFLGQPPGFLPSELRRAATADQTDGLAGGYTGLLEWEPCPWGLGVELLGHKTPHMLPPSISPDSYGHSGYSGALAWADPQAEGGKGVAFAILGGPRGFSAWRTFWQPLVALLVGGSSEVGEDR
jgi:beta-lactamase class C